MNILSPIKAAVIACIDVLDRLRDPFEDFTRPAAPKYQETLAQKRDHFERDLITMFTLRSGTVYNYRIPVDGTPLDLGDQAVWHGVATAMWAFKARVMGAQATFLGSCLGGLADQQPNGILARGVDNAGNYKWDASNDQASGHLAGLYYAWKYGNEAQRWVAAGLMEQWAMSIATHGHALINPDGKTTQYGALIDGWKTDPLRATLCMAIYAAAFKMTGNWNWSKTLDGLYRDHKALIPYGKVKLWSWDTQYDTHRAAIHLAILRDVFPDDPYVLKGIKRLSKLTKKIGNVWVDALLGVADRDRSIKVLSEFTVEDKALNTGRVNSDMEKDKVMWGGQWLSRQPIPRWRVSAQDFFWQRHLYALDFRSQGSLPDSRYNGVDFLAAYWLLRLQGVIGGND